MPAWAIPAKRIPVTLKLVDGTAVTAIMVGDESCHFYVTEEGIPVIHVADSTYRLAPEEKEALYAHWKERNERRNAHRFAKARAIRSANSRNGKMMAEAKAPTPFIGKKKGVVILINYSDVVMKPSNNNYAFDRMFNEVGYSDNGCTGSVHDYFYDSSYGKFDLSFDVYGPVTLSGKRAYYGQNDQFGDDKYAATMCIEAARLADKAYGINWTEYDWDNDGEVDQVFFVYAGYGENSSKISDHVWPHEFSFEGASTYGDGEGAIMLGGLKLNTYAASCELRGSYGDQMDGIGTACHEFSHCLGFPDMYNIEYTGGFNMNSWDLMASGSYNGKSLAGEAPSAFTAYERWFAGWLEFTELDSPCMVKDMPALQDSAFAYIIRNDAHKDEYFVLENRQSRGFFQYLRNGIAPSGMLAYHVDYNKDSWDDNKVNTSTSHQRMAVIPAGCNYGTLYSGDYVPSSAQFASQIFPGSKNVTELTNSSHSSYGGKLFHLNTDGTYNMNKPVTNISMENGLVSFTFMGGKPLNVPYAEEATDVCDGGFTAHWTSVPSAESYTLEVSLLDIKGGLALREDMSAMESVIYDSNVDVGATLDMRMNNKGWMGKYVYEAPNSIKLGTSSGIGTLTSPLLRAPNTEMVTVAVNSKYYNIDSSELKVSLVDKNNNELAVRYILLTNKAENYRVSFEGVEDEYRIQFSTQRARSRLYLYNVDIFDGDGTDTAPVNTDAKQTIMDIKDTQYTLTELTNDVYKYRVKAVSGSRTSEWSNYMRVDIASDVSAPVANGTRSEYFTIGGSRTAQLSAPGIYIERQGGKVRKVLKHR